MVGMILVSDEFRNILKSYAKDAIRAQPYDLISWSAAYFRCIVNNDFPPTKTRYESIETNDTKLTKGLLKTLVKQIGKGFFVDRLLLQKRWRGIGLPETSLLDQINSMNLNNSDDLPWLKLLTMMILSLENNFKSSIELICEILTNEPEGGSNAIPIWMFSICFSMAVSQQSSESPIDGTKIEYLSSKNFRKALLIEWKKFLTPSENNGKNIKFHNAFDGFKKSMDFDKLIAMLKEDHLFLPRDQSETDDGESFEKNHATIVNELGPPWQWMYEFAIYNNRQRMSFNFIETEDEEIETNKFGATPHSKIPADAFALFHDRNTSTDDEQKTEPVVGNSKTNDSKFAKNVNNFLDYLKRRSMDENGMIYPRMFEEPECPRIE